jgi:hypothetical protein
MRLTILLLAVYFVVSAAAQQRGEFERPFTGYEADVLSDVWPDIRQASSFEDIDWRAAGLERAPGSPEAQRFLAEHWDEARRAERFAYIDWDELSQDDRRRRPRGERYARAERDDRSARPVASDERYRESPFTREEAAAMSRVWGKIREAARFEDIDWRAVGLSGPPGDREARRLTSRHWPQLREAARFEEIDWQATTGFSTR